MCPTTYRCEVRPGPEFLVRRYEIFANGSFALRQFHYSDRDCARRPEFSVSATGLLRLERRLVGDVFMSFRLFCRLKVWEGGIVCVSPRGIPRRWFQGPGA